MRATKSLDAIGWVFKGKASDHPWWICLQLSGVRGEDNGNARADILHSILYNPYFGEEQSILVRK